MPLPCGRQEIGPDDAAAVLAALQARFLTQGPGVESFEVELAAAVGARYAVAFSSGTAALHAACAAAGLEPGASALTSPITFVATANAALFAGAEVRFADVDPRTALLDPDAVDDAASRDVRALLPVHFGGEVADLPALAAVAEARGWLVIEDASHALGAAYRGPDGEWHLVGSCRHSSMCCFSFHQVKSITTGEGGAVTTNDGALYHRLRRFRSHGITRDPAELEAYEGPWHYEQHTLGFNYRLTDLQCALGRSQLLRLGDHLERRRRVTAWYDERLAGLSGVRPLGRPAWSRGAHHLYVVSVPPAVRRQVYEELARRGVQPDVHYLPVPRQPFYRARYGAMSLPGADAYYAGALSLPLFPSMTAADVDRVVAGLTAALAAAGGRP
jgi:perosamine synthetase